MKRFPDKYTSEIGESGVMRKFLAAVVAILSLSVFSSAQAKVIDFSDLGGTVGISLNFGW